MEIRQTQGNRKLKQILEDLIRSKQFIRAVKKVETARKKEPVQAGRAGRTQFDIALQNYEKAEAAFRAVLKRDRGVWRRVTDALVLEFGVDSEIINHLLADACIGVNHGIFLGQNDDLCLIIDNVDEDLNPTFPRVPFIVDTRKQQRIMAFPVSIALSRYATKRDVLDFIDKRWDQIEESMGEYRGKKLIIRRRKLSRGISDFLWENRRIKVKDLKKKLNEKFPKNAIAYYEISKIIQREKMRRNGNLV